MNTFANFLKFWKILEKKVEVIEKSKSVLFENTSKSSDKNAHANVTNPLFKYFHAFILCVEYIFEMKARRLAP